MKKEEIVCDSCKKKIKEGHQQRFMVTVTIGYAHQYNDGGSVAAVDRMLEAFHLHFSCSKKMFAEFPHLVPKSML